MAKNQKPLSRIKICTRCGEPFETLEDADTCGCVGSERKRRSAKQRYGKSRRGESSPLQEKAIRELEGG